MYKQTRLLLFYILLQCYPIKFLFRIIKNTSKQISSLVKVAVWLYYVWLLIFSNMHILKVFDMCIGYSNWFFIYFYRLIIHIWNYSYSQVNTTETFVQHAPHYIIFTISYFCLICKTNLCIQKVALNITTNLYIIFSPKLYCCYYLNYNI